MREFYVQHSAGPKGPFQTVKVDAVRETPQRWHHGYGAKIPTRFEVKYQGRWRRVYVTNYGNAGSAWIMLNGERVSVSDA